MKTRFACVDCETLFFVDADARCVVCPECGSEVDLNERRRSARRLADYDDPPELQVHERRRKG